MGFGEYLRELRSKSRLTLREVEKLTGISNSYLSQVETGTKKPPHPDVLKKLASVYGVALNELMAKAGYLNPNEVEETKELLGDAEVEWAFEIVTNDPSFKYGTRITGDVDLEMKKFIVEMYQKATGRILLTKQ